MVHIQEQINGENNYRKIYGTDLMSTEISEWTHHVVYFEKTEGDKVVFAEAADTTVDIWMDHVYVGPAQLFDDCHRVEIDPCKGCYLFV